MVIMSRTYKTGIVFGCGLVVAGLLLQLAIGQIDWTLLAWPTNAAALCFFVAALLAMHLLRRKMWFFNWLSSNASSICSMAFAIIACMLPSWPAALVFIWLAMSLGLVILRVGSRRWTIRTVAFMLNHCGLLAVLIGAALGNADLQRMRMAAGLASLGGEPQDIAYDSDGTTARKMDFAIALNKFDQSRYASYVTVYDKENGEKLDAVIEVNRPISVRGWTVYQLSYDYEHGDDARYSIFELVRDPWLPIVYAGIFMILAGAVSLPFLSYPSNKEP